MTLVLTHWTARRSESWFACLMRRVFELFIAPLKAAKALECLDVFKTLYSLIGLAI